MMASRVTWLIGGAVVVLSIAAAASLPVQQPQEPPPRQDSSSRSVRPVSESVIGSWQAHGADDGPIAPLPSGPMVPAVSPKGGRITAAAPPGVARPAVLDQDWIIDLVVLWRWPGQAPPVSQGPYELGDATNRHRILVGDRELRVEFDPQVGTALVDGVLVPLNGANVLMLDVEETRVRLEGLATVEPRIAHFDDPVDTVMGRSPGVAAFVAGARALVGVGEGGPAHHDSLGIEPQVDVATLGRAGDEHPFLETPDVERRGRADGLRRAVGDRGGGGAGRRDLADRRGEADGECGCRRRRLLS